MRFAIVCSRRKEKQMDKTHSRLKGMPGMTGVLKASVAMVLVLALVAPAVLAKERRGHDVLVTKKDGTVIQGELLTVKGTDLIIMEGSTTDGITASLADVKSVKVDKHSKFLKGLGWGFLIGAPAGAILGAATGKQNPGWFEYTPSEGAIGWGLVLGGTGALIGGVAGAFSGIDKNVTVVDTSPGGLSKVAFGLRRYARDRS
jgi:hypothetical protein